MRSRLCAMPLLAALQLTPAAVHAAPVLLTLHRARALAIERSALVAEAAFDRERAQADAAQVGLGPVLTPTLEVEAGPCFGGGVVGCAGATFTFPLPLRGERAGLGRLAKAQVGVATERGAAARWRALNLVSRLYLQAVAASTEARLVGQSAVVARQVHEAAQRRAKMGDAAHFDLALAHARLAQREEQAAAALAGRGAALAALRRMLMAHVELDPQESLSLATRRSIALARRPVETPSHPAMSVGQALVDTESAALTLARSRTHPRLSMYAGYRREELHQVTFGVAIPLTWFSSVPSGEVARATSRVRTAEAALALTSRALRAALAAAQATFAQAEHRLVAAVAFEQSAGAVLERAKRGYELGHFDLLRVLQAEQTSLDAARTVVAARTQVAVAALLVAAGGVP